MSAGHVAPKGLEIFDQVPSGHIAFAVPDDSCLPMAERGEVLIVKDAPRTYPETGGWYLLQWIREPRHRWERATVHQTVGIALEKGDTWGHYPPCPYHKGLHFCAETGFSYEQLTDQVRGPIVGIYRPGALD